MGNADCLQLVPCLPRLVLRVQPLATLQQGNIVMFRENQEEAALRRAARGKPVDGASLVWLLIR